MALLDDIKELIFRVENEKPEDDEPDKEVDNEKVDKRKLIDEVGGILKGKVDDEIIRTIIGKLEKLSYDGSEGSDVDNKKVKNEDEKPEDKKEADDLKKDVKEDVENKCKNSVDNSKGADYYNKLMNIYNSSVSVKEAEPEFVSRVDREKAAEDYFKKAE